MTCRTGSWREDVRRFRTLYTPAWVPSNDNRIGGQHRPETPQPDADASARQLSSLGSLNERLLPSGRARSLPDAASYRRGAGASQAAPAKRYLPAAHRVGESRGMESQGKGGVSGILFPDDAIDATEGFLECLKGFACVLAIFAVCFYALPILTGG